MRISRNFCRWWGRAKLQPRLCVSLIPTQNKMREYARAIFKLAEGPDKLWLAIMLRGDGRQIGGIGLRIEQEHQRAELGYWLGVPYWGQGYATEAAREMLRCGFEGLGLHRIFASHFGHNPASGKILKKIGMRHEGCQREHLRKWGQFVDSELYGILRPGWERHE